MPALKICRKSEPDVSPKHSLVTLTTPVTLTSFSDITKDDTPILCIYVHFPCLSFFYFNALTCEDFISLHGVLTSLPDIFLFLLEIMVEFDFPKMQLLMAFLFIILGKVSSLRIILKDLFPLMKTLHFGGLFYFVSLIT